MDDTSALLSDSGEQTTDQAIAKAQEIVNNLDKVELNIAVTGETGAGKSSFVNAIRGVKRGGKGYAPVGVKETTAKVEMYSHPFMPNVKIWDLPGIGSPKFTPKTYLKDVKFDNYDFFLVVSASRFKNNDIMLAKEIKKQNKNFYFIRSKVDADITSEEHEGGTAEETLRCIRDDCKINLCDLGQPPVFLITSHDLRKFDFQTFEETLERDLPSEKRDALVKSLPVYSMQCLDKKNIAFQRAIWPLAAVSARVAKIHVPGVSPACDTAIIVTFLTLSYYSFGLDDNTLKKLSQRVGKPIQEEMKEPVLMQAIRKSLMEANMEYRVCEAIEGMLRYTKDNYNFSATGVSFLATRSVLREGLNELYCVAKKVLQMAGLE